MTKIVAEPQLKAGIFPKVLMVLIVTGVGVGAFIWGRQGAPPPNSTGPQSLKDFRQPLSLQEFQPASSSSKPDERPVALIYGNTPISREELGEYLIARFGKERIDALINRKIIKKACDEHGIWVSEAEVQAQVQEDLKAMGRNITENQFENQILRKFNKTMIEWKEDHIRPRIALTKLVKPMVKVEEQELREAFEARFGPRVKCRMIVLPKEDAPNLKQILDEVKMSEKNFKDRAGNQFIEALAVKGGVVEIHKHSGDATIENKAFSLNPNEVSDVIFMPNSTFVILKCDEKVPKDTTATFDKERDALAKDVLQFKINQKIPEVFAQLRNQANPKNLIMNEVAQNEFEHPAQTASATTELPPTLPPIPTGELPKPPPVSLTVENTPPTIPDNGPVTPPGLFPIPAAPPPTSLTPITPVSSAITPGTPPTGVLLPNAISPSTGELPRTTSGDWKPAPNK